MGVTYSADKEKTQWFDPRFKQIQTELDQHHPNNTNAILTWSNNLNAFIVHSYSDTNKGEILVYFPKNKKTVVHTNFNQGLEELTLPRSQVVRYLSSDGIEHESYLHLPSNKNNKIPAIIMVHGGPWDRFNNELNPEAAYLAMSGFAVMRVNFRGSTGFGRNYLLAGINQISEIMLDDIADASKWLIQNHNIDPARVFIMGSSYGGYAALMSTVRHPDLYAAAAAKAAPLDLNAQMKRFKQKDMLIALDHWQVATGGLDKNNLKNRSPINNPDKLKSRYLLFHGEHDNVIPVDQLTAFTKAAKKAGVDINSHVLRNEGHSFTSFNTRMYYLNSIIAHFNQTTAPN